ncbi:MAG: UDP-N-acetylmuramoyl-L-alanine--D-glutamate ligase [Lachnospiraceae bacterium]|nr:UDP-N-acetylmuramoyl-L-alanine--D-glutamate ligase [Lachnospiraceae bacterium]
MDMRGKKVLVIGSGISGINAASLLETAGAEVSLFDSNDRLLIDEIKRKFMEETRVAIYVGELPEEVMSSVDTAVLSPGVPIDNPLVLDLKERGVRISGEIELAYEYGHGDVLAVTGTNGKTTTTTLVGEICRNYKKTAGGETFVVGNIGNPYTAVALETKDDSLVVAEISSFQLETTDTFRPKVSAILNITPDHLNRHYTMENYVKTKERIALRQTGDDVIVLNFDDPYTRDFGSRAGCRVIYFTRHSYKEARETGCDVLHMDGDMIMYNDIPVIDVNDMLLMGTHNYENVMAAAGMTYAYGIPMETISGTIRTFRAVEHRIEYVRTVGGVDYYNDSKGTNPDAAIKGIKAMKKKTVLIGGGFDKKSTYDEWIDAFDGKVRYLVLLGQTAEKIAECAKKHGFNDIVMVSSMEEAVQKCSELAQNGDAVLLSPACASWGMFTNYEERGRIFKELVNGLKEQ